MPGKIQMPSSYVRIVGSPLDVSLTFDTLDKAKNYVNGTYNEYGTPYNGQIIAIKNILDRNICGVFLIVSNIESPSIRDFKLIPLEIMNTSNDAVVTQNNLIITTDSNSNIWLQVFSQIIGVSAITTKNDLLLSNKQFAYSILAISDLFTNNNGNISYKILEIGDANSTPTVTDGENGKFINSVLTISNNILKIGSKDLSYNGTNGSSFSNRIAVEIYINITDYLNK